MSFTVGGAFQSFRDGCVDLLPMHSRRARSSRNWLSMQLIALNKKDRNFPKLNNQTLHFGSFARKTKIHPLDDIDMMLLLVGTGTRLYRHQESSLDDYWLEIESPFAPLAKFPDSHGFVNSTKILNAIRSKISAISLYEKAEIKRTGEAVTLNLKSYPWIFDIVPAVPIVDEINRVLYYAIPNGRGDWKLTDPRIDQRIVTNINLRHKLKYLPTVRLLKYWNRRVHKPRLSSYYFETLAHHVFNSANIILDFPSAIKTFFNEAPAYINFPCPDPKQLGYDLDSDVSTETKQKVIAAMDKANNDAWNALYYESRGDDKRAIEMWGQVFGSEFPKYG